MARPVRRRPVNPERLNTPGPRRRRFLPPARRVDSEYFGQFAEGFARFMGTAKFLAWMSVFLIVWLVLNVVGIFGTWDPYPFILLTLALSMQASYAAPLILLAQNRQEARDRIGLEQDRKQAAQSKADMEYLAREIASLRGRVNDLATRDFIRSELRDLLAELDEERRPKQG